MKETGNNQEFKRNDTNDNVNKRNESANKLDDIKEEEELNDNSTEKSESVSIERNV